MKLTMDNGKMAKSMVKVFTHMEIKIPTLDGGNSAKSMEKVLISILPLIKE